MTVDRASASSATTLAGDGSTERAEFFGAPANRIFAYEHRPSAPARGAVVICSPLHGEFVRNYRREVSLARALAARGLGVLRFHYRFTGNSDGDGEDLTFDSMCDDALAVVDRIGAELRSVPLFLLGTRWGALIAASAARRHPQARVVLWEPLVDAERFFKDAFRRQLVRDVRVGLDAPTSRRELEARLGEGQGVDIVAHRIEAGFYRSAVNRSLATELGGAPRQVLVVQISSAGTVRSDLARVVSGWVEAGLRVEIESRRGDPTSWLSEDRIADATARTLTQEIIELTTAWISRQAEGEPAP